MKICSKCQIEKSEKEFFIKDASRNKLHAQCKDCYKAHRKSYYTEHYNKYRYQYIQRGKERRIKARQEYRSYIISYLEDKKCSICSENDIRTLEFDHITPATKLFSISQGVKLGKNIDLIKEEIDKCRILCANCHKKLTASQQEWYKL